MVMPTTQQKQRTLTDRIFRNPRLAHTLQSLSRRPDQRERGLAGLQRLEEAEVTRGESERRIEEARQKIFAGLLKTAVENNAEIPILEKLSEGAGLGSGTAEVLRGAGPKPLNPVIARMKNLPKSVQKRLDTNSIGPAIQAGDPSLLRFTEESGELTSLGPGSQLRDSTGRLVAENTNQSRRTFRQKVLADVEAETAALEKEVGGTTRLSDRMRLARQRIELNVARGFPTASAGSKMVADLNRRAETVLRVDRVGDRVDAILSENPSAATVGADVARSFKAFGANFAGLMDLIPGIPNNIRTEQTEWEEELNAIAGDDAELRTALFNLALADAITSGLKDQRLSNQMIQFSLQNIGANSRSPDQIRRKFNEVRKRAASALDTALNFAMENFTDLDETEESGSVGDMSDDALLNF